MKKKIKPCTFYIVRHGQTEWNLQRRMQGQKDSPLTPEALNLAKSLAKVLRTIEFAEVFSSDLLRAKRTAEIIALEHKLIVKTNKLIREITFGQFEGVKIDEFEKLFKDVIEEREKMTNKERFKTKMAKDIESDQEIVTRLLRFLKQTALAYLGKNVVIVAHGGIMRSLLIHLGFGSYQELRHGTIDNLGYYVLESDGIEFEIKETHGVTKIKI